MRFALTCMGLLIAATTASAETRDRDARKMAECGFLTLTAVQEMQGEENRPPFYDDFVRNVVDFTNLYYAMSQSDRPVSGERVSNEMLQKIVDVGKQEHRLRLSAMSKENAIRLSNRMLRDCTTDLADLIARVDAAKAPESAR